MSREITLIPSLSFFLGDAKTRYPIMIDDDLKLIESGYQVVQHFITMDRSHEYVFKQSCDSDTCNPDESPF